MSTWTYVFGILRSLIWIYKISIVQIMWLNKLNLKKPDFFNINYFEQEINFFAEIEYTYHKILHICVHSYNSYNYTLIILTMI